MTRNVELWHIPMNWELAVLVELVLNSKYLIIFGIGAVVFEKWARPPLPPTIPFLEVISHLISTRVLFLFPSTTCVLNVLVGLLR